MIPTDLEYEQRRTRTIRRVLAERANSRPVDAATPRTGYMIFRGWRSPNNGTLDNAAASVRDFSRSTVGWISAFVLIILALQLVGIIVKVL